MSSILAQPKRIALLAYVALTGSQGYISRERIMSVLWPESDEARARQSLRNGLYKIRQALGDEVFLSQGNSDVRLNPDLLTVDVIALKAALDDENWKVTVDLYKGPFLSGFHVDDCAEFEAWSSQARTSLQRDALRAFPKAAASLAQNGDLESAQELLARAQVIAPTDEEIFRQRVLLLARQGNRAAALAVGQEWVQTLHATLGIAPSESTRRLITELKSGTLNLPEPAPTPTVPVSRIRSGSVPDPRAGSQWRTTAGWILGPAALLTAAWVWGASPPSLPPADRGVIVERFEADSVAGGDAAGLALGSLTARFLDSDGGSFVLPAEGVMAASSDGVERRLFKGRLRAVGEGLEAEISLATTARPDEVLARATASVGRFDLETLALRLVNELSGQNGQAVVSDESVTPMSTTPAAILPFFQGELHAEAGRRTAARDAFRQAVTLDSTLAMAYFRLAVLDQSLGHRTEALISSDRAVALSTRMTPAEQQRLDAWRVYETGFVEHSLPLYESLAVSRGPDRDTWFTLAEIRFHWGPQLGVTRAAADSAFSMLLALAPGDADALLHRIRLMGPHADPSLLESLLGRLAELDVTAGVWAEANAIVGLNAREPLENHTVEWVTNGSFALESRRLTQLAASARVPYDLSPFIRALPPTDEPQRGVLRSLLLAQLAASAGRMREAREELRLLSNSHPARALEYRILLELANPIPPSQDSLFVLRDRLRSQVSDPGPNEAMMAMVAESGIFQPRASVLDAMLTRRLGEVIDVEAGVRGPEGPMNRSRSDYEKYLQLEDLAADGSDEQLLRSLGPGRPESHRMRPDPLSYLVGVWRWSRIQSLLALGRDEEALRWLGTIPDVGGYDIVYIGEAALLRARLLERGGRLNQAATEYGRALELWGAADPEMTDFVEEARLGVERTGGVPRG